MPDLDIVSPIAPGWYKPYKLIRGGAEPAEVGRAALSALGKALRRGHGLQSLAELESVAGAVIDGELPARDALTRLHSIVLTSADERHTKVAVRAVEGILAQVSEEPASVGGLRLAIATRFCGDLLAHYLYGPAWVEVLEDRFPAPSERRAFADSVAAVVEPQLPKLGQKLAHDPEATGLRVPPIRTGRRRSTAELLEEAIVP